MKNLPRPDHLIHKTFTVRMWERAVNKNPNWVLEGISWFKTDSVGRYQNYTITKAFELMYQGDRVIVLFHPKYDKETIRPIVQKRIMERYEEINLEY